MQTGSGPELDNFENLQFLFNFSMQDFKFRVLFWSMCGGQIHIPGAQTSAGLNCPRGSRGQEEKKIDYLDIPNGPEVFDTCILH